MDCQKLPIYYLNLEQYINTSTYESIKAELEVTYLPAIKYVEHSVLKYNLNNPLNTDYFKYDGATRLTLYQQMLDKVNAFIDGACGDGPILNEVPVTELQHINATPKKGGLPSA